MKTATLLGLAIALGLGTAANAQAFKIGSKNFTEQVILGELYAAALEASDIPVERKLNLGGTLIAQQALTSGDIDMYPEYTGTALVAVVGGKIKSDPKAVYDEVSAFYQDKFQLRWLQPAGINNGYAILVSAKTAEDNKLATLSDLAAVAGKMSLGAGPEFADRQDGIPGLRDVYGIEFGEFRQFARLVLRYEALAGGQIDVANGFATDWQIADQKFVPLRDDKGLFPPYFVAPVVREDALKTYPAAQEILDRVSTLLDNDTMQVLNGRVERDHEEASDVAEDFLREHGVIQ
ncbi:ABC transporter [Aureimonas flava]|uniref:ABC transporter n=1 Tax=Aureimonas flava TaxID=2320271 RepID=A0A3A1WN43_9HYPH|nr:glycine betaine ABC transporter substrate-binding protein [Aureimonas flava]RIY02004.1 ABC transporter [Aureimonas flava]